MSKEYEPLSMIKNSRFIKLFNCSDEKTRQDVIAQMNKYISESNYADEKNYRHLCNIFSSMAFYYVFQKNGRSKEESLETVQNAMYEFIMPQRKKIERMFMFPGFIRIMKWFCPIIIAAKTNGTGWDITYPKCGKDEYAFNVNKCIYAQIFPLYHVKELGPVFCHVDDILYGDLPKISFEYTNTICRGGKICDYVFRKRKE